MHRGVGDDGPTHARSHEVLDVLGDGGDAQVVFAGAFGQAEHEVGRVFVLHELPGFIDDEDAFFLVGLGLVPDVIEHDVHGYRSQFVFQVADIEDDHRVIDVDVALLAEDAGESTASVFAQTLRQLWSGATHVQERVVQIEDGRRLACYGLAGRW